jgi:hypothetical protein
MRSAPEGRGERGSFGLSSAVGPLDNQRVKGVGEHKSHYRQNSKNLPAGSNSSKRGLTIRGMFTPSGRPSRSSAQPGSPAPESDK